MDTGNIISLFGGVAMFLFGMSVMGDSLKKVAGSKMEGILYKLAGNPVKGILLGTVVTAVIQSSSATSVMVVGFVNSGMMAVRQAIGIVLELSSEQVSPAGSYVLTVSGVPERASLLHSAQRY